MAVVSKTKSRSVTVVHEYGVDLELYSTPDTTVFVGKSNDRIYVAYGQYDSDAPNPLDDCDGMGTIWHHPRSRYGRSEGYYKALGLDDNGEPIIDEEGLQAAWADAVNALSLQRFYINPRVRDLCSAEDLREALAEEPIIGDYSLEINASSAWMQFGLEDGDIEELVAQIEEGLEWDYAAAVAAHTVGVNRYAVPLDVYEHGLRAYSLAGEGTNCLWDTSRCAAVWVADKEAHDTIDERAMFYAYGYVKRMRGGTYKAVVDCASDEANESATQHKYFYEAYEELKDKVASIRQRTTPDEALGHSRALHEVARSCVEAYDKWQRGEVHTLWLDTFDTLGDFLCTDCVGGIYDLDDDTLIKCADAGQLIY